jgi:hypothetical protein
MCEFEYDSTPLMKKTEVIHGQSQEARKKKGIAAEVEAPEGKEEAGGQGLKPRRKQQDQEDGLSGLPKPQTTGDRSG